MAVNATADAVDVAIVGGGIAGLSAAHTLHRLGMSYCLLEGSPRLGGVIRTEREDGFVMEAGPDAILTQKPAAVELCAELGLGARLVPTDPVHKTVFVLHRGRLCPLPDGMMLGVPTRFAPMVTTGLFSWAGKIRMAAEVGMRPRLDQGDESIASFLGRHFGTEAVERIGEPLLAGIHAGAPEHLSMLSAFPRFVEMERRHGSLIRALWNAPRPGGQSAFVSLQGGLQELVDVLAAELGEAVRLDWPAASVRDVDGGWEVESATGQKVGAGALVLALPAAAAARLVAGVDGRLASALGALRSVSTAVVYLGYRRDDVAHPLDGYGIVVPRTEGIKATAFGFVSTKFPGRAPEGHVLLRVFLGGAREPDVLDHGDAALIARARSELAPILGLRGEPVRSRVFRWPHATPQMEVGHTARMADVEAMVDAHPGLYVTGAGLRGTGIPDMVADGARQAHRAAAWIAGGNET